jgi:hypothetical protein
MGLQDFLAQIPSSLIMMVCGSGVLLIVVWAFIIYRRTQRRTTPQSAPLDPIPAEAVEAPSAEQPAETAPAEAATNPLTAVGQKVRNFFFYTEEEREAITQQQEANPASTPPPPAPVNAPPDATEIMRIWRDVVDGSLIIQIGDEHYRTMGDVKLAGQERRFMAVLRELARLAKETGSEVTTAPPAASEPPPAPQPALPPAEPAPVAAAPLPQPEPEELAPPAPEPEPAPVPAPDPGPVQPVAPPVQQPAAPAANDSEPIGSFFQNVRKAVQTGGKSAQVEPTPEPPGIAQQIELILQAKIQATPAFQGRRIHIHPSVSGGVTIEADGTFYEAVSDIEDEDVRAFVQSAIQAWEQRSG